MIRLSVDLSLPEGSVSIGIGKETLSTVCWNRPKLHAETVYSQIDRALELSGFKREDIGEVIVSSGPGSFTGVRLSVTLGKSFKVLGVKVLSATTLSAISFGYELLGFTPVPIVPARRGKVYTLINKELLDITFDELKERLKNLKNPLLIYKGEFEFDLGYPSIKELTPLSVKLLSLPRELLSPLTFHYVREHDAKPKGKTL